MVWWSVPTWAAFAIVIAAIVSIAIIPVESEEARSDHDNE